MTSRDDLCIDEIVGKLVDILGKENVLTSVEDRYVYSHTGVFGTEKIESPIAVILSNTHIEKILELTNEYNINIILSSDEKKVVTKNEPYLIIDDRKLLNSQDLRQTLFDLKEIAKQKKQALRKNTSLKKWFTDYLTTNEGYRLYDRIGDEKDFCVVQSFFSGIETYSAKGRLLVSKGIINNELESSDKVIDILYSCTSCGQCYDQLGESTLELNNAIVSARKEIIELGWEPNHCKISLDNIQRNGNPLGMSEEDRIILWEEVEEQFPYQNNDVIYWPGCTTAYRLPEIIEATSELLNRGNVDFGLLGENEKCCGLVLYLNGQWDEAIENAKSIIEVIGPSETLVTSCAGCFFTFSKVFPRMGVDVPLKILHTSQVFDNLIKDKRLILKGFEEKVVWHDPCDLGRHSGVYKAPRKVLEAVPELEVVCSPLSREHTLCCGGGGGLMSYDINLAEKVADMKFEDDFSLLKVESIVTGCPACILNLRSAARRRYPDIKIRDLSELLVDAL
jgi:Fe-S oxidoreductase